MNASIKTKSLDSVEDVMEAADAWQAADVTREYKVRKTSLGNVCTLFERGVAVVTAGGQGGANAIANALEEHADRSTPDTAELRWDAAHNSGMPTS